MTSTFRIIDTGLREGRAHIAFDQALVEAHKTGDVPDTIRFLSFGPTALVGRHQDLSRELQLDYCRENGIGVVRRISGGGAIYLDEGQLGWELVFSRATLGLSDMGILTKSLCEAVAAGVRKLGVNAQYRPRSDIEVEGAKLCGTGGFFDGDTFVYQGTLLIDLNPEQIFKVLKVPQAKQGDGEAASQRMTCLRQLLGDAVPDAPTIKQALIEGFAEELDIEPVWGDISEVEETLARELHDTEIGTDEFVNEINDPGAGEGVLSASTPTPGGTVSAFVRLEGPKSSRVREVLVTGDFFVTPPRTMFDLEASLRGIAVDELGPAVEKFFESAPVGLLTVPPAQIRSVIEAAVQSA